MTNDPFAPLNGGNGSASVGSSEAKAARRVVMPIPVDAPKRPTVHPSLGKPSASWTYRDAEGSEIGFVHRFETASGKEYRPQVLFRTESGKVHWRWESWPTPRPLYGINRLAARPHAPVVVTEGEKAADAAGAILPDHVAISPPNGSKSAARADWAPLKGRHVSIWPDADDAGKAFGEAVAECLRQAGAASIHLIAPPADVAKGWDAADAKDEGWNQSRTLCLLAHPEAIVSPSSGNPPAPPASGRRRTGQRYTIMSLTEDCRLWHGEDGEPYVTFPTGGHWENWPIRSKSFKRWLASRCYEDSGLAPGAQAIEDTLRVLEARATSEGNRQDPWLRVGERAGRLYIDLCDRSWRAIEITAQEWRVLERHDLPFIRSPAMSSLPCPEAGAPIETLRGFVNVATDDDFHLVVAWLLAALRPRGPFPILVVNGEQGSGKSTFTRLLRSLVDPNIAPIRAAPKEERDLIVATVNGHVLALDNMSKVEPWLADALCRLATGGGFSTRALHTDAEEFVVMATRPILLNGIPLLTERADLAERSINVRLSTISEGQRRPEDEFWQEWEGAAPLVFGALCDALSSVCRHLKAVRLLNPPRLADFAKMMVAAEPGLGWEPGTFIAAYDENRRDLTAATFEADPVAVAIRNLMLEPDSKSGWVGTATELFAILNERIPDTVRRSRAWPASVQSLGNRIDRVAPLLRGRGVFIERRHSGVRMITIGWLYQGHV